MSATVIPVPPSAPATLPIVPGAELGAMIEPARTALLVIDVQNDFVAADGAMGTAGVDLSILDPTYRACDRRGAWG